MARRLLSKQKNTTYKIEKRGNDDYYIEGNEKHCKLPTKCWINGSTWGGAMLKMKFIGIGMHMEYGTEKSGTITTTLIKRVSIHQKDKL